MSSTIRGSSIARQGKDAKGTLKEIINMVKLNKYSIRLVIMLHLWTFTPFNISNADYFKIHWYNSLSIYSEK